MKQTIRNLFKPLDKGNFWIACLSISFIISVALFLCVDIGLAEVVRQNSYDIFMLRATLTEFDPANVSEEDKEAVRLFTQYLDQRPFALVLRPLRLLQMLYPKHSPEKALAPAIKALEKAKNEEEAINAIQQVRAASDQLYTLGARFPRSPIKWFDSEVVPKKWLEELDSAIEKSREMVIELVNDPTSVNAKVASAANRKTMLLLFPAARLGSNREQIAKKIKDFLSIAKQVQEYTNDVADEERDIETREQIRKLAKNEEQRINILNAMLNYDMDEVSILLRESIVGEEEFRYERYWMIQGPESLEHYKQKIDQE